MRVLLVSSRSILTFNALPSFPLGLERLSDPDDCIRRVAPPFTHVRPRSPARVPHLFLSSW